jgi:glycosyltransferase involved in cell wall biosynthesis
MRILVNMLGVQTGGARTYLMQMLEHQSHSPCSHDLLVLAPSWVKTEWLGMAECPSNVRLLHLDVSPIERVYFDQLNIPRLIKQFRCDFLWSANNYGCFNSPVPQLLMQCNPTFFSKRYASLIRRFGTVLEKIDYGFRKVHARISLRTADVTVFPTRAFMTRVLEAMGNGNIRQPNSLHHGFSADSFTASEPIQPKMYSLSGGRRLKLFYPTAWAPHKNFDVLFEALERLQADGLDVELWLPLNADETRYHGPFRRMMQRDFSKLKRARRHVRLVGYLSMREMPFCYASADVIVFPSWLETFGYPLVEARVMNKPLVAADTPTNREVAKGHGSYYSTFDPDALALAIKNIPVAQSSQTQNIEGSMTWPGHFSHLFSLMEANA